MPITVVQQTSVSSGAGTSRTATFASPTSSGNGIVVAINFGANTLTSIDDDGGNGSYTQATIANFFGANLSAIFYLANPASLNAVTAHFSSSTSCDIQAFEVAGVLNLDVSNNATGNTTNPQAGAITTTIADTIVFCSLRKTGSTITVPSGFASGYTGGNGGAAYKVYTTTQTGLNPQWTTTASTTFAAVVAAFGSSITSSDVNVSASQGFSLGQAFTGDDTQSDSATVGFALGSAPVPTVNFNVTSSAGFSLGASTDLAPEAREGFALGSDTDFLPTELFSSVSEGIGLGARAVSDSHELANGRYRR